MVLHWLCNYFLTEASSCSSAERTSVWTTAQGPGLLAAGNKRATRNRVLNEWLLHGAPVAEAAHWGVRAQVRGGCQVHEASVLCRCLLHLLQWGNSLTLELVMSICPLFNHQMEPDLQDVSELESFSAGCFDWHQSDQSEQLSPECEAHTEITSPTF